MPAHIRRFLKYTALITLTATSFNALAEDWPQWRGNNRDAKSTESITNSWPASGPALAWKTDNLGGGFSSPAVADGRVILLVSRGNTVFVVALSEADGSKLWEQRIGNVGAPDQQPSYPGARTTPAIDGERIYAMTSDGDFACLNAADGSVVWSRQVRTENGGVLGTWAYSESPIVGGDIVLCSPGGTTATVLAMNKHTGETVGTLPLPSGDAAGYASMILDNSTGTAQYISFLGGGLVGIEAATGNLLWRFEDTARNSPANIPTPIAHNGHVYSASSRGGGALIKLNNNNGQWSTETVYSGSRLPSGIGGMVLVDGHLYGSLGQGFGCVEFMTGEVKWADRSIGAASVIYADGKLILHGENGDLALVQATPEAYTELSRFSPPNRQGNTPSWTHPALANGKLFIHELGTVWAYQLTPAVQ